MNPSAITQSMSETIDSVSGFNGRPLIVQISDIHGYLEDARDSILMIGDTDQHPPIVTVAVEVVE